MDDASQDNGIQRDDTAEASILAALPRTRPQRASPRRAAVKKQESVATKRTAASPKRKPAKPTSAKPTAPRPAKRTRKVKPPQEPPVPKQGYEPEEEIELGKSVNPPSGVELVESVADIVGELASAGFTAGGRLLKDTLSLLRRP